MDGLNTLYCQTAMLSLGGNVLGYSTSCLKTFLNIKLNTVFGMSHKHEAQWRPWEAGKPRREINAEKTSAGVRCLRPIQTHRVKAVKLQTALLPSIDLRGGEF